MELRTKKPSIPELIRALSSVEVLLDACRGTPDESTMKALLGQAQMNLSVGLILGSPPPLNGRVWS